MSRPIRLITEYEGWEDNKQLTNVSVYNLDGLIERIFKIDEKTEEFVEQIYKYNDKGQIVSSVHYVGYEFTRENYLYDESGDLYRIEEMDANGIIRRIKHFINEQDLGKAPLFQVLRSALGSFRKIRSLTFGNSPTGA